MTSEDIFELARRRTPPPDSLNLPERMLHCIARNIYQSYEAKIISLEQAKDEKKQAVREYNAYFHAELDAKRKREEVLKLHAQLIPAIERGDTITHTRNGMTAQYRICGVDIRHDKDKGWLYSVILSDRKSGTLVYAAVDDVEVNNEH